MKLYLDEDISPRVAEIARGRCQLDVVSAHDIGAYGWNDAAQLRYAAEDGRNHEKDRHATAACRTITSQP